MQKRWIIVAMSVALYACQSTGSSKQGTGDGNNINTVPPSVTTVETAMVDTANAPVMEFKESVYSFGTIQEGEKVEHVYEFTNVGKSPLIISDVQASCGCTTPAFPTDPVKPGETGSIKVVFDSQGQRGKQQKIITILSNAHPRMHHLQLKGEVQE